jgi:hypothetical protein
MLSVVTAMVGSLSEMRPQRRESGSLKGREQNARRVPLTADWIPSLTIRMTCDQ